MVLDLLGPVLVLPKSVWVHFTKRMEKRNTCDPMHFVHLVDKRRLPVVGGAKGCVSTLADYVKNEDKANRVRKFTLTRFADVLPGLGQW